MKKALFYYAQIDHLIEGNARLFRDLFDIFSNHGLGLQRLFTYEQIMAVSDECFDSFDSVLKTSVIDYMESM